MTAVLATLLTVGLLNPISAAAAEARMHDLQWNVCDQYQENPTSPCYSWTPAQKAAQIELLVEASDWRGQALTVQEICKSTFDLSLSRLGAPWTGYFATTVLFSNDSRCRDSGKRNWGIGVLVKGKIRGYDNQYIGNDPDVGEVRRFLCGDVTIGVGQRMCTTHLTPITSSASRAENYNQFATIRSQLNGWALDQIPTSLGADLNRNVRSCSDPDDLDKLEQLYRTDLGPSGCIQYGDGQFYEADRRGDVADETTFGSDKLDYWFVSIQRYYADYGGDALITSYSDHKPLRAAATVH